MTKHRNADEFAEFAAEERKWAEEMERKRERFMEAFSRPKDQQELAEPEEARPDAPPPMDWRDIIAEQIRDQELSLNLLGQEAGVSPAVISRFLRRERDITVATAQRLCDALDLVLAPREPHPAGDD
jgi:hypothetical protein